MLILGIDPGLATTGWGVIEKEKTNKFSLIDFGCIKTQKSSDKIERFQLINRALKSIIKQFRPNRAAVEELFFYKNVKTALLVSEARGVVLLTIAQAKLRLEEYTPLQVKQALVGYGRADKHQIQQMVKTILGLKKIPKPDDAADALAVAITAAQTQQFSKNLDIQTANQIQFKAYDRRLTNRICQ